MVEGGHEYDGRPFMPLDEAACGGGAADAATGLVRSRSPRSSRRSIRATSARRGDRAPRNIPDAAVTCSSDLGRIGLLERENAGAAQRRARRPRRDTVAAFAKAIPIRGIAAPLFLTQNDGTVAEAAQALRLPGL